MNKNGMRYFPIKHFACVILLLGEVSFQITQWVNSSRYFIGLTDLENEDTFVWESGHNLASDVATHWKSGQPNGKHKENCVGVRDGEMWDTLCNMALRFVCQKRPSGV